jgi:hypothetical protein
MMWCAGCGVGVSGVDRLREASRIEASPHLANPGTDNTHRNGFKICWLAARPRDAELRIPKPRTGVFFLRCRSGAGGIDWALFAVVIVYIHGVFTRYTEIVGMWKLLSQHRESGISPRGCKAVVSVESVDRQKPRDPSTGVVRCARNERRLGTQHVAELRGGQHR